MFMGSSRRRGLHPFDKPQRTLADLVVLLVDEGNVEAGPGASRGMNIVGLPDGSLVMPMYGSLKQDVAWFDPRLNGYLKYPQEWPRQYKYRSWLLRSEDGGLNWHYHGTIAALQVLAALVRSGIADQEAASA